MAIDLNRPIGVSSAAVASQALPTKRTMNLLVRERKHKGWWKYLLAALGLALLVAAFAKFAVLDVFEQVDLKRTELGAAQQELAAVQAQLGDYNDVLAEYQSYTSVGAQDAIDALQVMELVGEVIQPKATVTSASTSEGMLVVNVKDISLDDLGKLAETLDAQELVERVTPTTAAYDDESNVSATLQIQLAVPDDGASEEGGR